jgi:isoleucyl-tRNA synthetase
MKLRAVNPLDVSQVVPVILDDGVSRAEGTAVLHLAPGCGIKDYKLGMENGLEIYSPVTEDGCYENNIVPR